MPDRQNGQYPCAAIKSKNNPVAAHAVLEAALKFAVQRFAHRWILGEGIERRTDRALYPRGQMANGFRSSDPEDDPVAAH
jgi:hypothetical protein